MKQIIKSTMIITEIFPHIPNFGNIFKNRDEWIDEKVPDLLLASISTKKSIESKTGPERFLSSVECNDAWTFSNLLLCKGTDLLLTADFNALILWLIIVGKLFDLLLWYVTWQLHSTTLHGWLGWWSFSLWSVKRCKRINPRKLIKNNHINKTIINIQNNTKKGSMSCVDLCFECLWKCRFNGKIILYN